MNKFVIQLLIPLFFLSQHVFSADGMAKIIKNSIKIHENKKDVISYTSHKRDDKFITELQKTYNGLTDIKTVNDDLKKQNYIRVLNCLWTESDSQKRLVWLEQKVNENHPILMFELAEAYYYQNPSLETYVLKSLPWLVAGVMRTYIDADCSSDASVQAAPEFLMFAYQEPILADLLKNSSQNDLTDFIKNNQKTYYQNIFSVSRQVLEPFTADTLKDMPSPEWVFHHGMGGFLGGYNTINPKEYNAIRKKSAQDFLDKERKQEKSLE